jgi:hypothetical protein
MTRLTFIILIFVLISCKATKQTMTYEKINSGQDLDKVTLISFDSFFNQWVFNKKIQKIDLNTQELNKDNLFTYFGKPRLGLIKTKWTFFKIYSDTLTERFPGYNDFYSAELSDYLWTKVVPKEEIDLWNYNRTTQQNKIKPNCSYKKNKPINNYTLIDNKVILTMMWEIECEELEQLKNIKYKASYNLLTKQFYNESIDKKQEKEKN